MLWSEFIKLHRLCLIILCLAIAPAFAEDGKKPEPKRNIRIFRPMVPIKQNVSGRSQTKTGTITITAPGLIPPPPIPPDMEEKEETDTVEPPISKSNETNGAEPVDTKLLSKSDIPPESKIESDSEEKSASTPPEPKKKKSNFKAPTTIAEISGPPTLENLRASAHVLAHEGLKYKFGRDDPKQGGMDCSGALQFLLTKLGIKDVPRTSYDQYDWLKKKKTLDDVYGKSASSKLFKKLSPGDLIFWGGTWKSGHRVSHVMMYMGYDSTAKKHYVFGAQSKSSKGILGNGVDVFELEPNRGRLIAHGKIPGLEY